MAISSKLQLLVVNPNSSEHITDGIRSAIEQLNCPDVDFRYFTSPSGPAVLASAADIDDSTAHTLGPVLDIAGDYDGVLIAGYGDLPLTALLRHHLAPMGIPVVSIFEASVFAALDALAGSVSGAGRYGIITTGQFYEAQLQDGVHRLLKSGGHTASTLFAGVTSTGISPERLKTESTERIRRRVELATRRLLQKGDVEVICIGGVILLGMEGWVRAACEAELGPEMGRRVLIVEQMVTGVESLIASARHADASL